MNDGANIMKTLGPGEGAMTGEDVRITFIGREWHVQAFIGTPHNGGALVIHNEQKELDREEVAQKFIAAACVCMCGGSEPPADTTLDRMAVMLGENFSTVFHQMAAHRASRGKPS